MDAATPNEPRPYWIPADLDFASLPQAGRLAISEILNPAYKELVLEAPDALQRTTGATFVFLLWLELLEQLALGKVSRRPLEMNLDSAAGMSSFDRLLRVIGAKQKAANFLYRLRTMRAPPAFGGDFFRPPPTS